MRFETLNSHPKKFEKIGEGTQKEAYIHETDSEAVTLRFKYEWSAEEMKAMFYIQKIAHILFLDETVSVRQVGQIETEDGHINYARTDRISMDQDLVHQRMQEMYESAQGHYDQLDDADKKEIEKYYQASRKDKRIRSFLKQYRKAGLENRLAEFGRQDRIDIGEKAFKYVDIASPFYIEDDYKELLVDVEKIAVAIESLPPGVNKQKSRNVSRTPPGFVSTGWV